MFAEAFSHFFSLHSQVTVVTSQPGQGIVRQLEMGLKDADLVSLKRLLVVQIYSAADWDQDNPSPEATHTETEGRKHRFSTCRHRNTHLHTGSQLVQILFMQGWKTNTQTAKI